MFDTQLCSWRTNANKPELCVSLGWKWGFSFVWLSAGTRQIQHQSTTKAQKHSLFNSVYVLLGDFFSSPLLSASLFLYFKVFQILWELLTLGCTTLAAFVSGAAQRAQVAVLQRAVSIITACATRGNQLEQVLLWHEAPGKCPATWKHTRMYYILTQHVKAAASSVFFLFIFFTVNDFYTAFTQLVYRCCA